MIVRRLLDSKQLSNYISLSCSYKGGLRAAAALLALSLSIASPIAGRYRCKNVFLCSSFFFFQNMMRTDL
jgi:hypothetical protein